MSGDGKGDMVKITIGKLYRVTGQTAQQHGVRPDIILPDAFDGLEIGEKFEKYALQPDSVKRNNYYKPLSNLPIAELAARSLSRVKSRPEFQLISKISNDFQKQGVTRTVPLKSDLFEKWVVQQQVDMNTMKGETRPATIFAVENHAQDKQLLINNAYATELNREWLESLASDIYIQEVYMVLADLINLKNAAPKN
jgi:carboxyl-terminal processing protease